MPTDTTRRVLLPEDLRRPPRYATRRDPSRATRGGKVAVLAAEMGKPLLPHQQYIADVATELNPPGSRLRFRYQLVVISLPRQTGKTTLMRPIFLERTLSRPGTQAFMTAQLGKDAAARWEDLVSDVEASVLLSTFATVRRGKGDQRCTFPNRSFIAPFAPGKKALHGYTPPLVFVDEGWAFSSDEGADLMRAVRPAQITRPDRQLFIVSAAGDNDSTWWHELVEAGRAAVDDPTSTMAYFEWSAADDADPYDPSTWDFHPGLDGLLSLEDLANEAKPENNTHADFLRGFLNRSTRVREHTVVDLDTWDTLHNASQQPPADPWQVVYFYDVAVDRTAASVWGAWLDETGRVQLHVAERRPGVTWLVDYVADLATRAPTIGADDGGPARVVTDELRRRGVDVTALSLRDYATAWTAFKADVEDQRIGHDASPALRAALETAAERRAGEQQVISRRDSLAPVDPLVAAMGAAELARRLSSTIPIY